SILFFYTCYGHHRDLPSFPTRRSSDLEVAVRVEARVDARARTDDVDAELQRVHAPRPGEIVDELDAVLVAQLEVEVVPAEGSRRSEEHTSELQSRSDLVCRLLLEKKKN